MRALFVTSETYPLAKTGGLADVSAALPAALMRLGIDIRVLMPAYPQALARAESLKEIARFGNVLGCGGTRLLETRLPKTHVPVWLVDCPDLYNRDGGPYRDQNGVDWADNALRFALLNHVAAGIANEAGGHWRPDVVHANDWHAGLLPHLIHDNDASSPATVFTIHNLAYQGLFDASCFDQLELPASTFGRMEFYGRISFLKAGLEGADAITAVSPTYAREILTPEYGCGLEGVLREHASRVWGVLNGADYGLWDPLHDSHLARNYTARSIHEKQICKSALQNELGLTPDGQAPLLSFMSRLVHQKMPDILLESLPELLEDGAQFVLVAEGDTHYETKFRELAMRYPSRVAVKIGYDEPLAHRVLAAADMLLHPSRFEPCGLVPMYAMRYGAIPVVRSSGGMADTVVDAIPENLKSGTATGFCFEGQNASELIACTRRALALYAQPISWRKLQATAMRQDFSWDKSAELYARLYRSVASGSEPERVASLAN